MTSGIFRVVLSGLLVITTSHTYTNTISIIQKYAPLALFTTSYAASATSDLKKHSSLSYLRNIAAVTIITTTLPETSHQSLQTGLHTICSASFGTAAVWAAGSCLGKLTKRIMRPKTLQMPTSDTVNL